MVLSLFFLHDSGAAGAATASSRAPPIMAASARSTASASKLSRRRFDTSPDKASTTHGVEKWVDEGSAISNPNRSPPSPQSSSSSQQSASSSLTSMSQSPRRRVFVFATDAFDDDASLTACPSALIPVDSAACSDFCANPSATPSGEHSNEVDDVRGERISPAAASPLEVEEAAKTPFSKRPLSSSASPYKAHSAFTVAAFLPLCPTPLLLLVPAERGHKGLGGGGVVKQLIARRSVKVAELPLSSTAAPPTAPASPPSSSFSVERRRDAFGFGGDRANPNNVTAEQPWGDDRAAAESDRALPSKRRSLLLLLLLDALTGDWKQEPAADAAAADASSITVSAIGGSRVSGAAAASPWACVCCGCTAAAAVVVVVAAPCLRERREESTSMMVLSLSSKDEAAAAAMAAELFGERVAAAEVAALEVELAEAPPGGGMGGVRLSATEVGEPLVRSELEVRCRPCQEDNEVEDEC
mmetsp:Transcript_32073/g.65326  ORF Transcript_32073/g.65326 Transcript_32073/m.65326 type:complete len:471 (-) Transcript_32073:87-1499(-)